MHAQYPDVEAGKDLPSRFGDQQQDFKAKSHGLNGSDSQFWVSLAVPVKLRSYQQIFSGNAVEAVLFVSYFLMSSFLRSSLFLRSSSF